MPIISGFIVSKLHHANHDENIWWCLKPGEAFANHHDYATREQKISQDEEEPEEPLAIMPKITAIVFFVAVTDFLAFFYKYIVDLLDIFLHLSSHPLALLGKQVLCLRQSTSLTLAETFNFAGASSMTRSICSLMLSNLPLMVSTALPSLNSVR